jgi:hypothetical protein
MKQAPAPPAPGAAAELPRRDGRTGWHRGGDRRGDGCGEGNEADRHRIDPPEDRTRTGLCAPGRGLGRMGRRTPGKGRPSHPSWPPARNHPGARYYGNLRSRAFCDLLYRYFKTGSSPMGRVTLLVYALLLASVACCLGGNAHAQTCSCKGSMLDHYKGGDSKPLIWTFEPYLVKPGDTDRASWICYLKIVSNESQTEARRINWEVASFYRRFVSPNASAASCATIVGEMKTSPRNGPLYHGIAEHYDTTVREPTEGWKESSVDPKSNIGIAKEIVVVGPNGPLLAQIPVVYFSPIEASFVLDLDTSAAPRRAVIKMVSSVASGKEDELIYEFSNSGNAALRVLVNLPNDGQLSTTVPIVSPPPENLWAI